MLMRARKAAGLKRFKSNVKGSVPDGSYIRPGESPHLTEQIKRESNDIENGPG